MQQFRADDVDETVTMTVKPVTPTCRGFGQAAALFDEYRTSYGHPPSPEATRVWLSEQLVQKRMFLDAAEDDTRQLCGFITTAVMPASLTLGIAWSIRDLYVAPRHRRAGIGRRLLQHVVTQAHAAGARRLSLHTETGNTAALALYTAAGFQPVEGLELLNLTLVPRDS